MANAPVDPALPGGRPVTAERSLLAGDRYAKAVAGELELRTTSAADDLVVAAVPEEAEIGFWKLALLRFLRHRVATAAFTLLALIALTAIVVPFLQGDLYRVQDYRHGYGQPFQFQPKHVAALGIAFTMPWTDHLLGTDSLGRDELARLIRGARVSLSVGLLAMVGYLVIGGLLGALAGYYGGWIDNLLMRFTDLIIAMPFILVVVAVTAAFGGVSLDKLILVIAFTGWFEIGRLMRSQFLVLRDSEFAQAARALGASDWRIITRHIMPNSLTPIIVAATLGVSGIVLLEAALGFLGYSIPPPQPSWGNMLGGFEDNLLRDQMYLVVFPSVALVVTALCINLVGDGIRDALDPRQR